MPNRVKLKKKKTATGIRTSTKAVIKRRPTDGKKQALGARSNGSRTGGTSGEPAAAKLGRTRRCEALHRMLTTKRQEIMNQIGESIGQSLTDDQQRRLEAPMDVGDQALMDVERELGISLLEMRNRKRQLIDEALIRLAEGTYGVCADCGVEISEKRLAAVPFAKLCVGCQSKQELLEKIENEEERH
jgi:DnaK suppressor protein